MCIEFKLIICFILLDRMLYILYIENEREEEREEGIPKYPLLLDGSLLNLRCSFEYLRLTAR